MTTLELRKTFLEVIEELKPIFPEVTSNTYSTIFNETAKKRYGQCRRISPYHFEISINKLFAEICSINKVKNTIVHEILHALPGGMTHKGDWARYAQIVNVKLPHYHITRTNFYKEYNQAIQKDVKYIVYCPDCGMSWKRYRKSSMVAEVMNGNKRNYHCPKCKTPVKVKIEN